MKFKNKSLVYSDCKKKCAVKYKDDEDKIKVCKNIVNVRKHVLHNYNLKKMFEKM